MWRGHSFPCVINENVLKGGCMCLSFCFQFPNLSILLAAFAACVGGTFQYGYNISVINAPTLVMTLLQFTGFISAQNVS